MVTPWLSKNPRANRKMPFGREQQRVINPNGVPELADELKLCPAHKPTPLIALPALAERLGIGELIVKDESLRFGFGAFKALGGVLGVYGELSSAVGEAYRVHTNFKEVMDGKHREVTAKYVFSTASSGNHGRAVAAGAKLFGNPCFVFLPKFTSAEKQAAIEARGAKVIRVDGDYEAAVEECKRRSAKEGWTIISDTSWEGYDRTPLKVMRGYTVLVEEVIRQYHKGPTHVFVQAGVGGLAAAVIGYLWARYEPRPNFIVVEPESADCWFQSNLAGKPALASGDANNHGRSRLPRDLAHHLAGDRARRRLVHDHHRGPGGARAQDPRQPAEWRFRHCLRPVRLLGHGGPHARLHRPSRLQGDRSRSRHARAADQQRGQSRRGQRVAYLLPGR